MELTLACGDVGDAVGDADDTRADGVAADAGDDGVAGVLAVAGVRALAVVTDVANVFALDAVAAVPRVLAVAGVCGDVISGILALRVLLDTGGVAVAPVADVIAADGADAAEAVLGVPDSVGMDAAAVLDNASALEVTALADDAALVIADVAGDAGVDGTTDADVAGVAGLARVAAEPVDAEASTVPVVDAVEAVPTDVAAADVSGRETSVALVATLQSVAGVAVASCDDGLALDGPVDVVSENNRIHPL